MTNKRKSLFDLTWRLQAIEIIDKQLEDKGFK